MRVKPRETSKKPKKKIGTITQERKACIAAFKKYPKSNLCWCCHHTELAERLIRDYGYMDRIRHIDYHKDADEKAIRFRNFRPVKPTKLDLRGLTRHHLNRQWPNNTWNGKSIF